MAYHRYVHSRTINERSPAARHRVIFWQRANAKLESAMIDRVRTVVLVPLVNIEYRTTFPYSRKVGGPDVS